MPILVTALVAGVITGVVTVFLWALLWTVLIPWPGHEIFYIIVFVLGGFGGAMLSVRGMLS